MPAVSLLLRDADLPVDLEHRLVNLRDALSLDYESKKPLQINDL